ncbi:NAD-glutamate dehydrogenase [Enteractinococcus fodinae]|uniref:Glutamate dehydrogenase n=1 Tax=Enteractinococcus fodinae TaxID=684663 RepID=A0ABU2AZF8_9MICC|nr:NAD-glutamate dehydrogenase [Enteractinococcus fodinae]MDR7346737.1 glutamate dehydrogenase [Enteractinococcus fodinae]
MMPANDPLWTAPSANSPIQASDELTQAYFRHVGVDDQRALGDKGRAAMVQSHLELAVAAAGQPKIAVIRSARHATVQVVHPDIRYLVDSVSAELNKLDVPISVIVHPIVVAQHANDDGRLTNIFELPPHRPRISGDPAVPLEQIPASPEGYHAELQSWISIQTAIPLEPDQAEQLEQAVYASLADARAAHDDFGLLKDAATQAAEALRTESPDTARGVEQAAQLLEWMRDDNFVFLGYREYELATNERGEHYLDARPDTGLGVLREQESRKQPLTNLGQQQIEKPQPLIITKTNSRSRVYRNAYMDFISTKQYDTTGEVVGERRFIGLWRPTLGSVPIDQVPYARELAEQVQAEAGFDPQSHSGAALAHELERYPRDEMLQMNAQELLDTMLGILSLGQRRRTKLFLRPDIYGRFMTAMVLLPRDRYNTSVRLRIQDVLVEHLNAESLDFNVFLDESVLARLFYRIQLPHGWEGYDSVDSHQIEKDLVMAVRSWKEGVDIQAVAVFGEDSGVEAAQVWDEAFPPNYRVRFEIDDAMEDISRLTALSEDRPSIYLEPLEKGARMKVYSTQPITLTTLMPILGELGVQVTDEYPFRITPRNGHIYYLYDVGLVTEEDVNLSSVSQLLEDTVAAAISGDITADAFNKLVLHQGIDPQMVAVLRSYGHYLRQLQVPTSIQFMAEVLLDNPGITAGLVEYFETRFSPELAGVGDESDGAASQERTNKLDEIVGKLHERFEQVPTLDADRLLRQYLTVMQATDRTNAYTGHGWLSFKLAPQRIPFAPNPRPLHEIWVHSPQVSGVHFRFGAIARGGLRWSDRREDFRTEVLSLVQTQQTKNAVIVPQGAKGGFYAHRLPDPRVDRTAWVEAGRDAYRTFMRGMLDITDNQKTGDAGIVTWTRDNIIRHDGIDTYLVVAADKGTAGFSDTANEIAAEYDHWLGDAFASGGSVGYDHKGMGITARGAWESVKSHFGMLGMDVENEPFTVVGIGDMSGDVFGNGMRRSRHTKLLAAFNHLHIFVDPNPEPEASFDERERLYNTPRSTWADYDPDLISAGGGVFDRTARSIDITEEMRQAFDIGPNVTEMTPNELIKTLLQAPVDLVYNGGIGTYIKASDETHDDVGDRANDPIRIDGRQLQARVVGEGGNLGATQAGRVEAALHGVRLNMDAIDNSGGVDASDHEVNIKILIDTMLAQNLISPEERTDLLLSMTDEVADLVLTTNVNQNALLRLEEGLDEDWTPTLIRHTAWLEEHAGLDREQESLPSEEEVRQRMRDGRGFVTPELAVLASYTKIQLMQDLLDSDMVDDEWFRDWLCDYFPKTLRDKAGSTVFEHPLAREIIAMMVANYVVDTGGITTVFRAQEETGADTHTVVESFLTAQAVYEVDEYREDLDTLPKTMDASVRWESGYRLRRLSDRLTRWIIHHQRADLTMHQRISAYKDQVVELIPEISSAFIGDTKKRFETDRDRFIEAGFPPQLAVRTARMFEAYSLMDIVDLAARLNMDPKRVIGVFFALHDEFNVSELLELVSGLSRRTRWDALSRVSMREDLYSWLTELTGEVLATEGSQGLSPVDAIRHWEADHLRRVARVRSFLDGISEQLKAQVTATGYTDLSMLTVVLRRLRTLIL